MVEGTRIGIAAKRIKSESQVKKRIPKAAKQIETSGLPGVIAIDTSIGLNPNNERITRPIPDEQFVFLHRGGNQSLLELLHRPDKPMGARQRCHWNHCSRSPTAL
jgi:hypothetical protein